MQGKLDQTYGRICLSLQRLVFNSFLVTMTGWLELNSKRPQRRGNGSICHASCGNGTEASARPVCDE